MDKIKNLYVISGLEEDIVTTKELRAIANIKKRDLREGMKKLFPEAKSSQLPGSKEASPDLKYYGIRKKTAKERLEQAEILITCGTRFEADTLVPVIMIEREEVDLEPMTLMDVAKVTLGLSPNGKKSIVFLQPTKRGQKPQYGSMRSLLPYCKGLRQFYKTGGVAASTNTGLLVVAAEGAKEVVVHDLTENKTWDVCPAFPGEELKQACFSYREKTVLRSNICTGGSLAEDPQPHPYEIELSGFLNALDRHGGAFIDGNNVGFLGVVTYNYENKALMQESNPESMVYLCDFWVYFLNKLD